jgi:hypothetical protein
MMCSGFLDPIDTLAVCELHPLILHLATDKVTYRDYDFHWICEYNPQWSAQTTINSLRQRAMMVWLLHYNLGMSLMMTYLGDNYTGAYIEVDKVVI